MVDAVQAWKILLIEYIKLKIMQNVMKKNGKLMFNAHKSVTILQTATRLCWLHFQMYNNQTDVLPRLSQQRK